MTEEPWITPAAAARIRGVSRQAIRKLMAGEKIRTKQFGGRPFVHQIDIETFIPGKPGRKKRP